MIAEYFGFEKLHTNFKTEFIAGLTTFFTMCYILVVNPKILSAAGIPFDASLAATAVTSAVGSILMGLYAKRPFAVAPYMGENAFIAFTVVLLLGYTWQQALAGLFIAGIVFFILTVFKVRSWLVNMIPMTLKLSFSAGLGMFLAFIGLLETGIIRVGKGSPLQIGDFSDPAVLLAVLGIALTLILMIRKVKAHFLISIISVSVLGLILGLIQVPQHLVSAPASLGPTFGKIDIAGIMNWKSVPIIFINLMIVFVDTMGTLIGVSNRAGLLDENKNLPEIEKPMAVDAVSTSLAAFLGTTTSGAYLESAAGIEAGGRSGLTAVTVGLLMLLGLFFSPLFSMIPAFAYGSVLFVVGLMMITSAGEINFKDDTEIIPALFVILFILLSYNMGIGMAVGFVVYPLLKVFSGRGRETNAAQWIMFALSLLFFIFYPY